MHLLMSGEYYRPPMLPTSEMGLNLNMDDQRQDINDKLKTIYRNTQLTKP